MSYVWPKAPADVDADEWRKFLAHVCSRGQEISHLNVSDNGWYYDVAIIGEPVPTYQIRRKEQISG